LKTLILKNKKIGGLKTTQGDTHPNLKTQDVKKLTLGFSYQGKGSRVNRV
jgi:hypothetical protein